ncbi:cysteine desulfurase NifS [Bacillus sp. AFS076308]|uniref:cysteine desulfurase family protein n=1 Tax=unclassified Bacillus (in: firmicutes) TaxID=185979 RepID=UPI000BF64B1F|nr:MULTISPECIES: cysteine desulfurase family protein [unclassified Bacillus (in: firmicutes)]PFN96488.1 cysteine desulfurase NifS [Bacillus sp. AFS076308]PGV46661.1 cysteine desulfurase NifS [Bacillus sp. AFS037270]
MIYFDNSATTKPYKEVLESFLTVSSEYFGNPSSLHSIGGQAERLLTQARDQVAKLLKVRPAEIYFTSGGTESNNMAIKGAAQLHRNKGRHIITSSVEHASVLAVMEQLSGEGFDITYLPVDQNGRVSVDDLDKAIRKDTILISIMQVNNEVGTIQPIAEIGELLKKHPNILFHVDSVQAVGKDPLSLYKNRVDFCSLSAHKFHGLKGTGVLFVREGARLAPLLSGGNQERKMRSGTENVAGFVALAKALRITMGKSELGITNMKRIQSSLRKELNEIEGVNIHTPLEGAAPNILNFSLEGIKSEVFIHALEQEGVFVSTTSACSSKKKSPSKTLLAMGIAEKLADSSIRISLTFDNTEEEARAAITAIKKCANQLRKVMK